MLGWPDFQRGQVALICATSVLSRRMEPAIGMGTVYRIPVRLAASWNTVGLLPAAGR